MTPKAQATKEKLNWISSKLITALEDTIQGMKRQSIEWENTFAMHISDKGLISRMYKEFLKLNHENKQPS